MLRLLTISLIFTTSVLANPIVMDLSEADAIKASEELFIDIHHDFSTIHGTFSYRIIPNLRKEGYDDYDPSYFKLLIPIYRHTEPAKRLQNPDLVVSVDDLHLTCTEMLSFDLKESQKKIRSQALWAPPENYEVAFFETRIPIEVANSGRKIRISYNQDHIRTRNRQFLYYTPYFENPAVWKGISKDMRDFSIWLNSDPEVTFTIKADEESFNQVGPREKGFLIFPGHLEHIKIEVKRANNKGSFEAQHSN